MQKQRRICQNEPELSHCVGIYLFDDFANPHPDHQIGKNVNYAALVRKWRLLQHRNAFHQAIVYNVLHDLIDKIWYTFSQSDRTVESHTSGRQTVWRGGHPRQV